MPAERSEFCLRWDNHHPNLITVFSRLLQNSQMIDVTLISENREIHAHKIVLSACSPFFQNIFLRNSCKHPVIVLTGIKYVHMKSLVDFIYNGEVNIFQDNLAELLRVANVLKIKGLEEVTSNETTEIVDGLDDKNDPLLLPKEEEEGNTLTTETIDKFEETTKNDDVIVPSTSDQTKSTKKRKSVTFSDAPEIVWGELNSTFNVENSGSEKRRSSLDMCSITKIKKENEESEFDSPEVDKSNDDELFVSINPHSLYTTTTTEPSTCSSDSQIMQSNSPKSRRISGTSRKMIRKNENFLRALKAVRDEGMGFCKAAKIYGVNNRTLWLEYQKLGYPMKNARKKTQ